MITNRDKKNTSLLNINSNLRVITYLPAFFSMLLVVLSYFNFLAFHTLAELFFVFVCGCMFMLAVSTRLIASNSLLLYLACGYFWVGLLDVCHAFAYQGVNFIFEGSSNLAIQFWLSARGIEALVLLSAALITSNSNYAYKIFFSCFVLSALALSLIFSGNFPAGYIDGQGLSTFKIISEYLIIGVLAVAMVLFNKQVVDKPQIKLIQIAILLTIVAELCFTLYVDVYGAFNVAGHILKILSAWILLYAVVAFYVIKPYQNLRVSESRFKRLFQQSEVSIWNEDFTYIGKYFNELRSNGVTDLDELFKQQPDLPWKLASKVIVRQVNDATLELFEAKTYKEFIENIDTSFGDDAIDVFRQLLLAIWNKDRLFKSEANYISRTGKKITAIITLQVPQELEDFKSVTVSILDISKLKAYQDKISHQANYDFLTDLPNRHLFHDRLSHALDVAKRNDEQLSILFLDLDGFKHINDSLGHEQGDELLKQVAERLVSLVRKSDTVARLGGDEFSVLLEHRNYDQALDVESVAAKLIKAINEPFQLERGEAYISVSIGVTSFPKDGEDPVILLRKADSAMYRAKNSSALRVKVFDEYMELEVQKRLILEQALRDSTVAQEFELQFQPIVGKNNEVIHFEALLRWNHNGETISPDQFIPLAEEIGLIQKIGAWVLYQACNYAQQWNKHTRKNHGVSVNLSSKQFNQNDVAELVQEALQASGLSANLLTLEITESLLFDHGEDVFDQLRVIRKLGVNIALDDFGTGYSSLSYLKKLPANIIKIDRSFIAGLPEDKDSKALVKTILNMAKTLKLTSVAEGIETKEQLDLVNELGSDRFQGFYFSKPMSYLTLIHWLETQS